MKTKAEKFAHFFWKFCLIVLLPVELISVFFNAPIIASILGFMGAIIFTLIYIKRRQSKINQSKRAQYVKYNLRSSFQIDLSALAAKDQIDYMNKKNSNIIEEEIV